MKYSTLVSSALIGLAVLSGIQARADNMVSIAITPATGVVTLTPRWSVGAPLAGYHYMAGDLGLGGGATQFYSITGAAVPDGGNPTSGFIVYSLDGATQTPHADIGSKLTPDGYSALTSADPNIAGYGEVNLYTIHHKGTTDYLTAIIPGAASASAVTDERPMSGPGDASIATGVGGYFALTFSADNLGTNGDNLFYYLRADSVTHTTWFGVLDGAHAGVSADRFNLGISGHNALAYTTTSITTRYGANQMYLLRLDPVTGFTILATLNPSSGKVSDISNLGSVYSTLTFIPNDPISLGANQFYLAGAVNPTWQSVSFEAISDRDTAGGSFTVTPTASSTLPITLTVVSGSVGQALISDPVAGVFTITPISPGLITLQATQVGQAAPAAPVYEANMLRQSFTITGTALLAITTQPAAQIAVTGTTAVFTVVADGSSTVTYQWRKDGTPIVGNLSATTDTLTLAIVQPADDASYDVVVTNLTGSIPSDAVTLTVNASPITFSNASAASGIVGTAFSFAILASDSPTAYTASPLPAGLSVNAATGIISGTPTAAGSTIVAISAGNISGTAYSTVTIAVIATPHVPVQGPAGIIDLTNGAGAPPAGTVYYAKGLPAGLVLDPATGLVTGTTTARPGTYRITYGTVTTDMGGHKTYGPVHVIVFVIDPLLSALSGSFEAILEVPPVPGVPSGKVELMVNAKTGTFTGKLTTDTKVYALRGTLALNATFDAATGSVTILRGAGNDPYQLDLAIDSTLAADQVLFAKLQQLNSSNIVVSTISQSDTGVQLASFTNASPTPWADSYTLILSDPTTPPNNLGLTVAPEGTGYGMITIRAASGLMVCKGQLGDGTRLTSSLSPSADGSYRWFVKPYQTGGSFAGWIKFVPVTGLGAPYQVVGAANSELYWSKTSSSHDASYRAGFGPVVIAATAQRWSAPSRGTPLSVSMQLAGGLMSASFTSADLPLADIPLVPTSISLNVRNRFVVVAPSSNSNDFRANARTFNGAYVTATGQFTGVFTLQDSRRVAVTGVLLQQPSVVSGTVIGEGFFLMPSLISGGESVSGKVQFTAP